MIFKNEINELMGLRGGVNVGRVFTNDCPKHIVQLQRKLFFSVLAMNPVSATIAVLWPAIAAENSPPHLKFFENS